MALTLSERAEAIVDRFVANTGADDLLTLENDIRGELYRAFALGFQEGQECKESVGGN